TFSAPAGIALDSGGGLYVTETFGNRIRHLSYLGGDPNVKSNWLVSLVAGDDTTTNGATGFVNGTGSPARFNNPNGIAIDRAGNLLVADISNSAIRKITPGGVTTTFAGTNTSGYADGVGASARFSSPSRVCVDTAGYAYVSETGSELIRRISPS